MTSLRVIAAVALLAACAPASAMPWQHVTAGYSFDRFVVDHGKAYGSPAHPEHALRRALFEAEKASVLAHNAGSSTYKRTLNKFSDLTSDEMHQRMGGRNSAFLNVDSTGQKPFDMPLRPVSELPTSLDWRKEGVVTAVKCVVVFVDSVSVSCLFPCHHVFYLSLSLSLSLSLCLRLCSSVSAMLSPFECFQLFCCPGQRLHKNVLFSSPPRFRDQGQCGSCWTFATTETVESYVALSDSYRSPPVLSTQQLVSCAANVDDCGGTGGCQGGIPEFAYMYIKNTGQTQDFYMGYTSVWGDTGACHFVNGTSKGSTPPIATVDGYVKLPPNNYTAVMNALQHGPLAINVAAMAWKSYSEGVYTGCTADTTSIDHVVQLVGYGTDPDGGDYWCDAHKRTTSACVACLTCCLFVGYCCVRQARPQQLVADVG